jgi:hypothetical protein
MLSDAAMRRLVCFSYFAGANQSAILNPTSIAATNPKALGSK